MRGSQGLEQRCPPGVEARTQWRWQSHPVPAVSLCVRPMALDQSPLGAGDLKARRWAGPPLPPSHCPSILGPSAPASSLPEGQVDSLLSIISSQRERFRARNQELEAVSCVPPSATLHGPEDRAEDTRV